MNTRNEYIIKSIACLAEAYKALEGNRKDQNSIHYLIGQTIRQYKVPDNHIHVSEGALNLWNELTSARIENFEHRETIQCDKLVSNKKVDKCTGNSSKTTEAELHPNEKFCFRDIFHSDHVIPVSLIHNELIKLDSITEDNIKNILDKMHICKLLKTEDRSLSKTRGRTLDFEETIKNVYNKVNIKLVK